MELITSSSDTPSTELTSILPLVEYVTQILYFEKYIKQLVPAVERSSTNTSKLDITSASIAEISVGLKASVTVLDTSNVAISPVIEGCVLGILVVGGGTGCDVGRAVTKAAQNKN